jgi:hypothetical protein
VALHDIAGRFNPYCLIEFFVGQGLAANNFAALL